MINILKISIMTQYIEKAAVVAEIEKLQLSTMDEYMNYYTQEAQGEYNALVKLETFLDTLEVKEVDSEAEERMEECPFRQVCCTMYEGKVLECNGACSWVVDYPKLKELKAE